MTVTLRVMVESDLDMVLAWRNAENVRKNMYTHHVISPVEHQKWWAAQHLNQATKLLICEMDNIPVGVVTFTEYTGVGGVATWAFYSCDQARRGVGSAMECAALEYAFEKLNVRRLQCEVLSFNQSVIDFHRKYGFTLEGIARFAYKRGDKLYDIYRLSMLSDEWFGYLKRHVESKGRTHNLTGHSFKFSIKMSEHLVDSYARVTGDNNAIHLDTDEAKRAGLKGRVVHGMLIGGFFSRYFANKFPGPGTIYVSQTLTFRAPVLVGSDANFHVKVISHIGRRIHVDTEVSVGDMTCVSGEATLVLPKGFSFSPEHGAP